MIKYLSMIFTEGLNHCSIAEKVLTALQVVCAVSSVLTGNYMIALFNLSIFGLVLSGSFHREMSVKSKRTTEILLDMLNKKQVVIKALSTKLEEIGKKEECEALIQNLDPGAFLTSSIVSMFDQAFKEIKKEIGKAAQ